MIVVDASIIAVALADDGPDGDTARARLRGEDLTAPELLDLEVASVLRRQHAAGALDDRRAALALDDLQAMPIQRAPHRHLLRRCWELRENITVYDAAYVALAQIYSDAQRGPQAAVDVRAGKALGIGSEMVAPGLNMIGAEAGCRYLDRVPAYHNNLYRLGLIWFSREPLEDPLDYQVLEAQPDVIEAKRAGGRAKTVRRSIMLTPFGEDFCRVCLPLA